MDRRKLLIEGAVIVVSILLAFGIDAWWDERKERAAEREVLAALETEFKTNLAELEIVISFHTRARGTIEELFTSTDEEIRSVDSQRRSEYIVALCNPWSFYPVLGTTEALIGAGELDILESRPLRERLTNFLFLVEDSLEDIEYVGNDAERVWVAEVALGGPWADPGTEIGMSGAIPVPSYLSGISAETLLKLRNDQNLRGLVGRCHLNVGYYLTELMQLQASTVDILELIAQSR